MGDGFGLLMIFAIISIITGVLKNAKQKEDAAKRRNAGAGTGEGNGTSAGERPAQQPQRPVQRTVDDMFGLPNEMFGLPNEMFGTPGMSMRDTRSAQTSSAQMGGVQARATQANNVPQSRNMSAPESRNVSAPQPQMQPRMTQPTASRNTWTCRCGSLNRADAAFCVRCGRPRAASAPQTVVAQAAAAAGGSMAYASTEGAGKVGSMAYYSTEGASTEGGRIRTTPVSSTLTHVVKPVTESGHAHTESSAVGLQSDENVYSLPTHDVYDEVAGDVELPYGLELDEKRSVIQGLLYAEILGKPKALRHG